MLFFALFASLIRIGLLSDQSCRYDLIKAQSNQCCCCSSGHKYKYTKYKYKYTNQSWLKLNQIRAAEVASKLNSNSLTLHINSNWYVREAQCPVLPRCIQHFSDGHRKITFFSKILHLPGFVSWKLKFKMSIWKTLKPISPHFFAALI